jgi:hypothetical protein
MQLNVVHEMDPEASTGYRSAEPSATKSHLSATTAFYTMVDKMHSLHTSVAAGGVQSGNPQHRTAAKGSDPLSSKHP